MIEKATESVHTIFCKCKNFKDRERLLPSSKIVFFVVGTIAVVYSLAWYLQKFWLASGEFFQGQWDRIVESLGDEPETYWLYGSNVLTLLVYWCIGGIYTFMDFFNKPAFLRRFKIQPGTNEPVSRWDLLEVMTQVLFNQLVVGLLAACFAHRLIVWRGYQSLRILPTFQRILLEIAFHIICEEIGFYYSHRLLHNRHLYRYIHKRHHEWTAPIAITAIYCHPIEHLISNLMPPFLGVFILGSHVTTAWIWFCMAVISTLISHSGYHFPLFPSPEAHDFHHLKFNQCYGVLGVLDWLHGTDIVFRKSKAYQRHIMLLSLVPATQLFPDDETSKKLDG